MKLIKIIISIIAVTLLSLTAMAETEEQSDKDYQKLRKAMISTWTQKDKVSIDTGLEYRSSYFWRGMHFYGESVGVFFPWVGTSVNDFYFTLAGEMGEGYLGGGAEDKPNDIEKDWIGLDFIVDWSKSLMNESYTLGLGAAYYMYPGSWSKSYGNDGKANDFIDLKASLKAEKILLNPTLTLIYSFHINGSTRAGDSRKDLYLHLAGGHDFDVTDTAVLTLGGSIASFYYPSLGAKRDWQYVSDIQAFARMTVTTYDDVSIYSQYSFGITPLKDLNQYAGTYSHWTTIGASYSL